MIYLKNNNGELIFDETTGCIEKLTYCNKNYAYNKVSVFEIALRNLNGQEKRVCMDDFKFIGHTASENEFICKYENKELSVDVKAILKGNIEWYINIKNNGKDVIEWVNFPQIIVPNDLKNNGGNSKILWGFNEGALIDNMDFRNSSWGYVEPQFPSEGIMGIFPAIVEMQCMAYYDDNSGLYFAAHDKNENLKGIDFYECKEGIKLQFRHYTGCEFEADYIMPYPMVMQFFNGDWMDAASIYRDWFEKNKNDEFIPIKENKKIPNWYGESPVIVTYPVRGLFDTDEMTPNKLFPYCNAMEHIERLEKSFESKIMVILMHWEGTAPWAPPIVWPPYGGEDELKKFIDKLHERGDVLGVYCSGLGWTQNSNLMDYNMEEVFDKENLKKYMCISPEQELIPSKICTAQRSGYDMCPTQDYTVNVIKDQVSKMVGSGIDYIQLMDQNHGGTSYFCYSQKHGHAPVPGEWQVKAVKSLLKNAEKDCGKVLFGCESAAAETYIPQLLFSDNRFNLCYTIGEPVPMYSFIYHKYLNNFMGNQVCGDIAFDHKKSPDNLLTRIAYSFCSGDMLTVVINDEGKFIHNWGYRDLNDLPNQDKITMLIKNLNYWRQSNTKKYLHTGNMTRPYAVEADMIKIFGVKGFDHEYKRILSSAWITDEGEFGQFLVNHTDKDETCIIKLPENEQFRISNKCGTLCESVSGSCELKIDKLSAVLVEKI